MDFDQDRRVKCGCSGDGFGCHSRGGVETIGDCQGEGEEKGRKNGKENHDLTHHKL